MQSWKTYSMIKLLQYEILDWISQLKKHLESYHDDGPTGCFLEVDLDYFDKLHGLHNNYLLATEKNKSSKLKSVCLKSVLLSTNQR